MVRRIFWFVFLSGFVVTASAQNEKNRWVDSVFQTLKLEQKIGQLFMVRVASNNSEESKKAIREYGVGGVIFMEGGPVRQARLTNILQNISDVPLLIGQDAEWGLGMRLDSTVSFPRSLVLGAIQDNNMIYAMAKEIGREMKMLGVQLNFAPVADINHDPENPFISYRAFGSDKENVAAKSVAYLQGLQAEGVLACAKHFALKGLTVVDVSKDLPVLQVSIDSVNMYPFQKLFQAGLPAIMPAPIDVPIFYEKKAHIGKNNFSTNTLSAIFTGDWLKKQMNFKGLVIVDVPSTQSATSKFKGGDAEMFAFQAGNDILLSPGDVGASIRKIKKLVRKQKQYEAQLNFSVRKILEAKYDAGLHEKKRISTDNLVRRLNTPEAILLRQKLYESAITVIRDQNNFLPVQNLENNHFAYITSNGTHTNDEFFHYLSKYVNPAYFTVNAQTNFEHLRNALPDQEVVIVGIFPQTTEDVIQKLLAVLRQLNQNQKVILCDFGHGTFLKHAADFPAVITAYTNAPEVLKAVPQVIFGGLSAHASLPFSISSQMQEGTGKVLKSINRLGYSMPEDAGMDSQTLLKIETIAHEAIDMGATPGCYVLVAREGKVIYEKSFGYLTYEKQTPVSDETIYDLASVTKVSATLQAVMFMQEKGMIDINKKASVYLPELKSSNKKDFTLKDILTHQAGLWPFLPFWAQTMKDSVHLPEFYEKVQSEKFPLMVAENLYAPISIKDSLWNWIVNAKIREKPARTPYDYRYSDMGFYILQHLAEKILNQPLEDFLQQNLYEPLGAYTTGYLPLQRFPADQIAPTEKDLLFRKKLLVGTVHDQGAAMQGGIAGHAGLFSNANDLAKLGQMLLQKGNYGGYQFYKPETIEYFTQKQFDSSRRGLGWDKPVQSDWNSPTSLYASPRTFGHTGFTGTCIWVDPEFNLVYIFLSNRVHPSMTNNKLLNANIRSRIQDVVYQSIFNYCNQNLN